MSRGVQEHREVGSLFWGSHLQEGRIDSHHRAFLCRPVVKRVRHRSRTPLGFVDQWPFSLPGALCRDRVQ